MLLLTLIVTSAGGLGMLVGGGRPREPLHFVYAVVALAMMPFATSLSRHSAPRRQGVATFLGSLVALIVILRLFGTG